jgi:glycosyltransferase involved in cell wall biosynthesis
MKRIAFISANDHVPWGGSEYCWAAAAEKLVQRGAAVSVSVTDFGAPVKQVERLRSLGCKIFSRGKPGLLQRVKRRFFAGREYVWTQVKQVGAGAELVVITVGGTLTGLPLMEAVRSCGFPYAIVVQSGSELWWPSDSYGERLAAAYEDAQAVYFVCEANMRLVRCQFATPLERARVIRNPFNVDYDAHPAWPDDSSGAISLACVARLDAVQKGQEMLMDVLSMPHWRERNLRVSFYGDGLTERALRKWAETSKLSSVDFGGFAGDIEQLWSRHHGLVLPSRFEGMPLALVEAMLCGRAAIVTNVGGNGELVRDGVNGFIAKAPTVEFIDEALNRAWENRAKLKEMGERAAADVHQIIPPDPTEDFVQELTQLVNRMQSSRGVADSAKERNAEALA